MNFENYYTVVESDLTGKTVEVFHTPTKESREFLKKSYEDEGLNESIWVLPLNEALSFVKERFPDRTNVLAINANKKVKEYIKSQGFVC